MFVALACGSELALGGTVLAARPLTRTTSRLRTGLNNLTKRITANLKRTRPLTQRQLRTPPTATGAESALSGALLKTHLRQLEKYGQGGVRELESGRIRYYGNLTPAAKQGEMAGRRLVREWDPSTGGTRTWHETIDLPGNIRIVRPETGGPKTHYGFDEFGNYGGAW